MKLVATIGFLSDTHGKHKAVEDRFGIPQCDILVHAGDFTMLGGQKESMDFLEWFAALDVPYKVLVAGNHDIWFDSGGEKFERLFSFGEITDRDSRSFIPEGIIYLENEAAVVKGIKFYGTPIQPQFKNWAFNVERDESRQAAFEMIPEDTQILVTHCPPRGVLDTNIKGENCGDKELALRIINLPNLKMNVFGHIHESRGVDIKGGITYINATNVNRSYHPIHKPYVFQCFDGVQLIEKKKWQKLPHS